MIKVGKISDEYMGLHTWVDLGEYFWVIDDGCGDEVEEEIPEYLYDALIKFENERKK